MRVRLVLNSVGGSWILGRFAHEFDTHLRARGLVVDRADEPSDDADVNHWLQYIQYASAKRRGLDTVLVTHIDQPIKLYILHRGQHTVSAFVCLSAETVDDLARRGINRSRLTAIVPPPDEGFTPRRIVIGLTTRLYDDGRKREDKLLFVARSMSLRQFHFDIIGSGWEAVIPQLENAGATVRYFAGTEDAAADYDVNRAWVPGFDYYLYTGEDEGSMGFLDACAAGVPAIVTPQGFHRDIPAGMMHPFWTGDDLLEVFRTIEARRLGPARAVQHLSWQQYVDDHVRLWETLRSGAPITTFQPCQPEPVATPMTGVREKSPLRRELDFWVRPSLEAARRAMGTMRARARARH